MVNLDLGFEGGEAVADTIDKSSLASCSWRYVDMIFWKTERRVDSVLTVCFDCILQEKEIESWGKR